MTAPVRGWAVVTPQGEILPWTFDDSESGCEAAWGRPLEGYTVIRVTITPEETK